MSALEPHERHILKLAARDADEHGWANVSKTTWPWVSKMPAKLVELQPSPDGNGGRVRITEAGHTVLEFT